VIIAYVFPGDPFPVTESHRKDFNLLGKGLKGACVSHYVLTTRDGMIINQKKNNINIYDELVFAQESALLPAFIIEIDKSNMSDLMNRYKRELPECTEEEDSNEISGRDDPKYSTPEPVNNELQDLQNNDTLEKKSRASSRILLSSLEGIRKLSKPPSHSRKMSTILQSPAELLNVAETDQVYQSWTHPEKETPT